MNTGVLRLRIAEPSTAQAALAPDDDGHVTTRVEGPMLLVEASAASPMGLLRSLDDILGCLRALEGADD